jgi:methylmalonyl-CoA mutase cobalamin-binding subunit
MLGPSAPTRGRVLLAGLEGDGHILGLQMVHDQLAAAGYHTALDTNLSPQCLAAAIDQHTPDLLVVGAISSSTRSALDPLMDELRETHPELPVLLGGITAGAAPGELQRDPPNVPTLERIDLAVPTVEELMGSRAHALG